MYDTYNALRRHADNDLAAIRQHLDSGRRRSVNDTHKLARMTEALTRTVDNLDRIEQRRPYSDNRQYSDINDAIRDTMDMVGRILPHLTDDMDDTDMRRGRRGRVKPGPPRDRRLRSMDDDYYDYSDDDAEARRGGRRRRDRYGRFIRSDADMYNDRYDDDMRYDDVRRTADEARRAADEARRTAAEAMDTARRMMDDNRRMDDTDRNINPAMRRNDRYRTADDMRQDETHRIDNMRR